MSQSENAENPIKSKQPSNSAFKQQRLPAWQPRLTASTVLPTFFIIGIAFIPIGVGLLFFSDAVNEYVIDYTDCLDASRPTENLTCASVINSSIRADCQCHIQFTLERDFLGKVYMYYGLSNFYQNHRRYAVSRDDFQLLGQLSGSLSSNCKPFHESDGQPIAPCGAIANSLFNDTLQIKWMNAEKNYADYVPLLRKGIAWPSDKLVKFRNPPGNLEQALKGYSKPIAWSKNLWELDTDPDNNGFQNEDLIVWMRTAALPNFRKLYRLVDHSNDPFTHGLSHGNYTLEINYRYPVSAFDGSKQMILSTTSPIGGKNPFLGFAYIFVGCICLLLGVTMLFIHIKYSKHAIAMIDVNPRTSYT